MGVIRKKRSRTDVVSDALHTAGAAVADRVSALTGDPRPRRRRPPRRLFGLVILVGLGYAVARRVRGSSADQPVHVTSAPQTWAPRPVPAAVAPPDQPGAETAAETAAETPAETVAEAVADAHADSATTSESDDATAAAEEPSAETATPETATPEAPDEAAAAEPSPPRKRPAKKAAARPRSATATSRPPRKAPAKKATPKPPPGGEES